MMAPGYRELGLPAVIERARRQCAETTPDSAQVRWCDDDPIERVCAFMAKQPVLHFSM